MEKAQDIWNQILDIIHANYDAELTEEVFSGAKVVSENNGVITVLVETGYIQKKINTIFAPKIKQIIQNENLGMYRFKFVTKEDIIETSPEIQTIKHEPIYESNLNDSYTFNSFIVGESNRFAHRVALTTADQPGQQANPLYIFGGVGIGKTHLMHAIGNYILDKDVNLKVLYIKTQEFITDFQKAAQSHDSTKFDEKYDNIDVLLVDDIQMLGSAKKTQEKFFDLFNKMYDNNKQIVITSDKPADQLPDIMLRLTTRFGWGMQVDINNPDTNLKINILKRKLKETSSDDINIDDEILKYISDLYENIRDLEGCLRRVLAYATMTESDINMDLVKESLSSIIKSRSSDVNNKKYDNLKSIVSDFYNISVEDLISKKRQSEFVIPRHITMYVLKTKYKLTNKEIANLMGKKDHSTVISACGKMEEELKVNTELKTALETILRKIN